MFVRSWLCVGALTLPILCGCATTPTTPAGAPQSAVAAAQPAAPDPARVYADCVGRTEDFRPANNQFCLVVLNGDRVSDSLSRTNDPSSNTVGFR